jgi:hypothetical protein
MMADATHTQGPWKVKFQARKWDTRGYTDKYWHDQWVIKGPNNKHSPVAVVRVEGFGSGPSKAVRKANATLIAAAPDLLAALEGAYQYMVDYKKCQNQGLLDDMQAAIAKAKGG